MLRGGLTPGELGHRLGLTSGGVTALTGRLIDAGYVRRERHPSDGRMRVLGATEAGAEFLRAHLEPVLDVAEAALSGLSDADAELLADVLERVASTKDADAAATPGPEREYASDGYSRALLMYARPVRPYARQRTNETSASTASGSNCVPAWRSSSFRAVSMSSGSL